MGKKAKRNKKDEEKLQKYIDGYTEQPGMEKPEPKNGDPQRSAMTQYLLDILSRTKLQQGDRPRDTIVDFGSGDGVLAFELERIWPPDVPVPYYIAVDLPDPLEKLALPARIHNRSQKMTLDTFYSEYLTKRGADIGVVIIRNVLHEMDIAETAELVWHLNQNTAEGTRLYVQDITDLPRLERGNVGWDHELLSEFLSIVGVDSITVSQCSFSGNKWFILQGVLPGGVTDLEKITKQCANARRRQYKIIVEEISQLGQTHDKDSRTRLIQLNANCGSLSVQLRKFEDAIGNITPSINVSPRLGALGICVRKEEMGAHDFAVEPQDDVAKQAGLIAILSNKFLLDFPSLYRNCHREILLSGYSLRALLLTEENREALKQILRGGKRIRILLVAPDSEAAKLRALARSYREPDELCKEIRSTIELAKTFNKELWADTGQTIRIELRLTHHPPPCSYFFVDDWCFLSLYSNLATGSCGQCLVYGPGETVFGNNYFDYMHENFEAEWNEALEITDD